MMSFIYIILIILFIVVIVGLSGYVHKYKKRAQRGKHTIRQLNNILNVLNKKTNIEIFLFNVEQDTIQKLTDGKLEDIDRMRFDKIGRAHV